METLTLSNFVAGVLLCNCVPHLVTSLQGMPFPTPFATPPGIGNSTAPINFLWGMFNLLVGSYLLWRHPVSMENGQGPLLLVLGVFAMGVHLSRHFSKVRAVQR